MLHARTDYQRIQDPAVTDPTMLGEGSTPIAPDEPVMLFRGQDRLAPLVLIHYAELLTAAGKKDMAETVTRHAIRMTDWQHANGSKTPDMPEGVGR